MKKFGLFFTIACIAHANGQQTFPFIDTLSKLANFNFTILDSINVFDIHNTNQTIGNFYIPSGFAVSELNNVSTAIIENKNILSNYFNNEPPYIFSGDTFTQLSLFDNILDSTQDGYITIVYSYIVPLFEFVRTEFILTNEFSAIIPSLESNLTFLSQFVNSVNGGYFITTNLIAGGRIDIAITIKPTALTAGFPKIGGITPTTMLQNFFENYLSTGNSVPTAPLIDFTESVVINIVGGNSSMMGNGNLQGWTDLLANISEIISWSSDTNFTTFLGNTSYDYSEEIENINNYALDIINIQVSPTVVIIPTIAILFDTTVTTTFNYVTCTCIPISGVFTSSVPVRQTGYQIDQHCNMRSIANYNTNVFSFQNNDCLTCISIDNICRYFA
jgi:hypothetical protein